MDFEAYLTALRGKTVSVIGIGVSNRPLIEKLLEKGVAVTARDKKESLGELGAELAAQGCKLKLGEDYLKDIHEDVIFRTPGLRPDVPELAAAVARGSVITSEMEAFFEVCPCPILAVTGSDGKTTTTTIISKLLAAEGKIVHVGGNIGHPLLCDTPEMAPEDAAVLELSSFQLMTMQKSPHIAVTTNLAPNHLDVHKDYQEYIDAKANIFTHQSPKDIAVFNADNADSVTQAAKAVGEKSIAMLHVSELTPLTGYVRGGCSPVGMKKQLRTVFASQALAQETILVSAGKIGYQVEVAPQALIALVRAGTAELTIES